MVGWMDGQVDGIHGWIDQQMHGWGLHGWMDRWIDKWMDGGMDA